MSKSPLALIFIAVVAAAPALAEDGNAYQVTPCNFGCKLWRNVSGHVNVPLPASAPDAVADNTFDPTPEEEARRPDVNRLVVVHGDILKKSAKERAHERAEAAARAREIEAMRTQTH